MNPRPGGAHAGGRVRDDAGRWVDMWSEDDLLILLRWLALRLGHTPRVIDVYYWLPPSPITYYKKFGSMTEAVRRAGLQPNSPGRGVEPVPDRIQQAWGWLKQYDDPSTALANKPEE